MLKRAPNDHPIQDCVADRWSPYGYSDEPVSDQDLRSIFEAARWAASAYNEQPWRYIVATKEDAHGFERLLSCLVEGNQRWAKRAPVLALAVISTKFAHNDKPNRTALHDLGLASGNLCAEATARGLHVHQMAGILPDKARDTYGIPADFQAVTGIAIGYAADPETLPEPFKKRDLTPRTRKPLRELVFGGKWGEGSGILS
jgi:nitroreductase